jgi:hypothetical protein
MRVREVLALALLLRSTSAVTLRISSCYLHD